MLTEKLSQLPDVPGIYLFYSRSGELIYVGKATSLKSRVGSYFRGKRTPRPIEEMIHEVVNLDWITTDSVLEAVILESIYIKKHQPKYNVIGKDNKSWNYIVVTSDEYPRVTTMRERDLDVIRLNDPVRFKKMGTLFGPYPGLNTKEAMKILRRLFHFSTCEPGSARPCLYYEMGQCLGVCIGAITPADYRRQVTTPLMWFLAGKKKQVIRSFEKRMITASKAERFEEAAMVRNQLKGLQRIHDVTLINKEFFEAERVEVHELIVGRPMRIEGYDISNLGASDKVGSMVVFSNEGPVKSEYRKFTIKGVVGQSDIDCLAEVLTRRFSHLEWQLPDVVLIDGGRPQVNRVKKVFESFGLTIPFVGIAKGKERKRNDFIIGTKQASFVAWLATHQPLLIRVRDEAHRFAITFNRSKRKIPRS